MTIRIDSSKPFAQGDVMFFPVDSIPESVVKQEPENGQHVVAHSETGHNHQISADTVDFFMAENDEFVGYIDVKQDSQLTHLRNFHTHETIEIPAGNYRIVRQREYSPAGYRRAAD